MDKIRELKDLNLLDRFLFAEASELPEVMIPMLEIILGKDVVLKHLPQAEKEIRRAVWSKIVRMDVLSVDREDTLYEMEVQKSDTGNLLRRSRAYNSYIDSNRLRQIHDNVQRIKGTEEVGIRLMNAWEEKMYDRLEAYEEGHIAGETNKAKEIAKNLKASGIPIEVIAKNTGLTTEEIEAF